MADLLVFDNVRPSRLTLDELLAGRVAVQWFEPGEDVPAVLRGLPELGGEPLDGLGRVSRPNGQAKPYQPERQ